MGTREQRLGLGTKDSLSPSAGSLFPVLYSRLSTPCSLFATPDSLLPIPCFLTGQTGRSHLLADPPFASTREYRCPAPSGQGTGDDRFRVPGVRFQVPSGGNHEKDGLTARLNGLQ
jgi:hypothetical protein